MRIPTLCFFVFAALILTAAPFATGQQRRAQAPKTTRLYILDCGVITGLNASQFGFKPEELPKTDMYTPCYLIAHPRGTMMWDVGEIPDSQFKAPGPAKQGPFTVTKPLLPQLAALGYAPADITYLGLSHYHGDHTANANAFAGSTWLVQEIERTAMFAEPPPQLGTAAQYAALKNSKTILLHGEDKDVFGDGTVIIKSAPGHTPGHQVLFLKLAKTGPVLLAGDLYHYPEELTLKRVPSFDFNKEQTAQSRTAIEDFVKKAKAQLWIQHDAALNAKLKKAPQYYD